ncbi:MAG: hypothetical protein HY682_06420 [Chloroflexi bacterium]|nr:hypothetical protein [Chloroflexota bacterium]
MSNGSNGPAITITTPAAPPEWALLERRLLDSQAAAVKEFFDKYFDERGYLRCVPRWGGNDGPDDAAENMLNWTMLHALGAPEFVLELYSKAWEGHLRQYTEAKTVEVPLARDGMYFREFPVMFDWFHHGEWLSAFILEGLSNPNDRAYEQRLRNYAGLYLNEHPLAQNYDPKHRIIRSMFNGSRGPLLRKATGLDWAGDPIEVTDRFKPGHGEDTYEQFVEHFKDYNDVVGDNPLNLGATTLAFNAYAATGDRKYRDWALEYIDAWVERTAQNEGLMPTNVGLDGTIGGECNGKWYGGVYGWGFSVTVPQTKELAHRSSFQTRCYWAFANAVMLTGDLSYLDTWRTMIDKVNENSKIIDGKRMYPRMFGDQGWYTFQPERFDAGAYEIWYWSMRDDDLKRTTPDGWTKFLRGRTNKEVNYPAEALKKDFEEVRKRVEGFRTDTTTPDTRMSDDMNNFNPAVTESLTQLMLGGLPTGRNGYPLSCRARYFDPTARRAGLPKDVAALVDRITADEVNVNLVNLSPVYERDVVIQGGAYGEHQIAEVRSGGERTAVNGRSFRVRLGPGCGARIAIRQKRYANQPSLAFPWG